MNVASDRQWWPFAKGVSSEKKTAETVAKLDFLTKALRPGVRPFVQHGDTEIGAIADNGRECLVVRRGKQRAEVVLVGQGETRLKHVYFDAGECEAFRKASAVALQWIMDGVIEDVE